MRHAKSPINLSKPFDHQLTRYALAATAAGVGVLAVTQQAEAKVVYTKTHQVFTFDSVNYVDFNHDGVNDITLLVRPTHQTSFVGTSLWGYGSFVAQNGVKALTRGTVIGPNDTFSSRDGFFAAGLWLGTVGQYSGNWANDGKGVKNGYAGVKFQITGQVHYGWARFNVEFPNRKLRVVLTGYAYETVANKPIIAGKTKRPDAIAAQGTLGELATGTAHPHPKQVSDPNKH